MKPATSLTTIPRETLAEIGRFLPPRVRAMVDLQLLTAMRTDDLCAMRPMDVHADDGPRWTYWPANAKAPGRPVPLGPAAQAILRPLLSGAVDQPVFPAPRQYSNALAEACTAARVLPFTPAHVRVTALETIIDQYGVSTAAAVIPRRTVPTSGSRFRPSAN